MTILAHSPEKRLIPSSINSYLKLYDRFAFFQPFFINRCHYKNRTLLWRKKLFLPSMSTSLMLLWWCVRNYFFSLSLTHLLLSQFLRMSWKNQFEIVFLLPRAGFSSSLLLSLPHLLCIAYNFQVDASLLLLPIRLTLAVKLQLRSMPRTSTSLSPFFSSLVM